MTAGQYIVIPGSKTHELPPLLVQQRASTGGGFDSVLLEADEMLDASADPWTMEQRRLDLAVQLTEQYKGLVSQWSWGDSVLEWIRQCEITFECEETLRNLLHPDVWPHASRASFVRLLCEKDVPSHGVPLEKAVGLRLAFREPPPIGCV